MDWKERIVWYMIPLGVGLLAGIADWWLDYNDGIGPVFTAVVCIGTFLAILDLWTDIEVPVFNTNP